MNDFNPNNNPDNNESNNGYNNAPFGGGNAPYGDNSGNNPFGNGNYNGNNPFGNQQYNGNTPFGNNGYGGGYNNGYPPNMYGGENGQDAPVKKGSGFAVASFVIALVNMILCCTMLSVITVPLCLIFSIISLAGKRKGTAFAVIGLVVSLISGLLFAYYGYIFYKLSPDFMYFVENHTQIIEEYDKDGTIPERFEKYKDPKYDKYWDRMGFKSFEEFFDYFVKSQRDTSSGSGIHVKVEKSANNAWLGINDLAYIS